MMAQDLIQRAQALCRHRRIHFPSDLLQYAHQWHRERFDLELCWRRVKPLLSSGLPLWQAEVGIRRHHDQLQRDRNAKDLKAGEPLMAIPTPDADRQWDFEGHQQAVPPPASASGTPDDPDGLSAERHPAPGQPHRARAGTLASRVREFLRAHVVRRGPSAALKLERMARSEGLLREDQEISRCSSFRRVMKELGIESHRIGFGRGAEYVWRLKPPALDPRIGRP
jgi:hypothetical protein